MNNYIILLFSVLVFSACGVKEQADQLQALEKCTYEIVAADSVNIAGTDVNDLINHNGLNITNAPKLAFSYLQQRIPLKGTLQLKITNPGAEEAGINEFDYKIFIKDTELLTGRIDQKTTISPNGGTTLVPIKIDKDVYPLLSDSQNQKAVNDFLTSQTEKSFVVTFKIKPSLIVGSETINYPDYISINKEITNTRLLEYLRANR